MRNRLTVGITLAAVALAALQGCNRQSGTSDLFVLEELEAAGAVGDPEARIERLIIFTKNYPEHRYRVLGYRRAYITLADEIGDRDGALAYFKDVLSMEQDPMVRGDMFYARFAYLWGADREAAVSLAEDLCAGSETYYRLFFYLALYLMEEDRSGLVERCFEKSIELAPPGPERAQVVGEYGAFLDTQSRTEEALDRLAEATAYGFAYETLGRILWERHEREEAIEAYLRLVARVPDARSRIGLDSLYAVVHPGKEDLHERIMAYRLYDGEIITGKEFVDIDGGRHELEDYRGMPLVIVAFSPT